MTAPIPTPVFGLVLGLIFMLSACGESQSNNTALAPDGTLQARAAAQTPPGAAPSAGGPQQAPATAGQAAPPPQGNAGPRPNNQGPGPANPPPAANQEPANPPQGPNQAQANPPPAGPNPPGPGPAGNANLDARLRQLIDQHNLGGDPSTGRQLPDVSDPLAQLGMRLFFSKSLGGEFDSACVSCHHPALGGADGLSLSVGVQALAPDLLGPGREHISGLPPVPRNAPSTFNSGLWDRGMFLDSRVESLNPARRANGANGQIRTPDSPFGQVDPNAGANLPAAQARFPVTSVGEMRGGLEAEGDNAAVRAHLAARIGDYGLAEGELQRNVWLALFQSAFATAAPASELVTFDNIALALAEYERSQTFIDTPWRDYVQGDNAAIDAAAKRGAILFYTPADQGGGNCVACHSGDRFSDERHHTIAFPQIGPGKGDGSGDDDFARERETGNPADRYRFRTPSLLNIALTAPYGHAGSYQSLNQVLNHYNNPNGTVDNYFDNAAWCRLPQFRDIEDCESLYPNGRSNSQAALDKLAAERRANRSLFPNLNLGQQQRADIVAFLRTLTDRCAADRNCLSAWIPPADGGPDDQQLQAIDRRGQDL